MIRKEARKKWVLCFVLHSLSLFLPTCITAPIVNITAVVLTLSGGEKKSLAEVDPSGILKLKRAYSTSETSCLPKMDFIPWKV